MDGGERLEQSAAGPGSATPYRAAPPRQRLSQDELRVAFAENLFDLFRAMAHLPGGRVEETASGGRHLAAPFNPMFKGVWRSRLAADDADAAIDEAAGWFAAAGAPFAFWWVDPEATPSDLSDRLRAHGWVAWEEDAPGMAADLDTLDYGALDRVPAGYRQVRVSDEAGLADFLHAFVTGFEVPPWAGQAWIDATLAFGIERAPWRCYVGYLDEEPVASTILFNGAGVAGVFGVATAPAARRQGIGAAITLVAYQEARELGYRYGVLFGTEDGGPVYRRIGFRDVDATISRYLWQADPSRP